MNVINRLETSRTKPISCVEMHTCGEPTRIVVQGYPMLTGTLLEQRAQAQAQHDEIRKRLILEPRGHYDMYGALLRPVTEKTQTGEADIGVLFMTNDGYSTMCGHATIALGRFLIDTHDTNIFPRRNDVQYDSKTRTVDVRIHAPCGVLHVTVPTIQDGKLSDPSRPVTFESVQCFATGIDVSLPLKREACWPEIQHKFNDSKNSSRNSEEAISIKADFAYGGAFYCLVSVQELGFETLSKFDWDAMNRATRMLKKAIVDDSCTPDLGHLFRHPSQPDLSLLYGVIVTDQSIGHAYPGTVVAETGLCFFSDQEVDRSPTGSGVSARLAASYARGNLRIGESRTYHSLISVRQQDTRSAFVGEVVGVSKEEGGHTGVRTRVSGYAYYTGTHTFVVEDQDSLGDGGFIMQNLAKT